MFHTIDSLGGWTLSEIAFLYGATGFGLAAADLVVGRIERLGQMIRTGRLDSMFLKPLPLLTQVCADEFALRRFARLFQAVVVLGIACTFVSWTPAKVLVTLSMVVSGSVIFFAVFIGFACIQFWTIDANEVANAFTYGGNTMTQYPLTVFPREVVTGLTVLIPLAFVNWYPALYVLDKPDPFGFPEWLQFASPVVAAIMMSGRPAGVAHRRPPLHVDGKLMTLIEVRDLERRFVIRRKTGRFARSRDEVVAVRDLTFDIEAGEMVGYIGPNGAGKSTTIKMLTGILVPTSGHRAAWPASTPAGAAPSSPGRSASSSASAPRCGGTCPCATRSSCSQKIYRHRPARHRAEPGGVRRAARPRRPPGHAGAPAQPGPADARRHRGRAAARPRDPVPRRADHRARRRQQGPAARVPARAQRQPRHDAAAHHPRPARTSRRSATG